MKIRNMTKDGNIIWFGSAGKINGNKIPASNYVENSEYVAVALRQKLSIIKGELWYDTTKGLPLLDKIRDKIIFDKNVLETINNNYGIKEINSYSSTTADHNYYFKFVVTTIYNDTIEVSS